MDKLFNQNPVETMSKPSTQTHLGKVVLQMAQGAAMTQTIYVAAKLGLPELIAAGTNHLDELATATKIDADILYRLLRALISLDLFEEPEPHQFQLTPLSECLLPDSPNSVRNLVLLLGEVNFGFWGHFLETIHTGESAVQLTQGMGYFDHLAQNPTAGQIFNQAMRDSAARLHPAVLAAYDFSAAQNLVDVGGGDGNLLGAILVKYPALTGVLFDQPEAFAKARPHLETLGVANRCQIIAGSFLESVPPGGDCYLLMRVLHNWSDADVLTILQNIRRRMTPGGKLIVIERCLPETPAWIMQVSDLTMLLLFAAKERTVSEFERLLNQSGLSINRVTPTKSPVSIIEAEGV